MTPFEQIWVAIAIGVGFLLFIEGAIAYAAKRMRRVSGETLKMTFGIGILVLAIVQLKGLTSWLSLIPLWLAWVVLALVFGAGSVVVLIKILKGRGNKRVKEEH